LQVLIVVEVERVEGITLGWDTVRSSEVDGDAKADLTASEYVLHEVYLSFKLKLNNFKVSMLR